MKVRLDETLFKARAQENLSMTNDINKLEQVDALVECLDHFVADRKWVNEISRDELLTMVTQSNGDKEVLIESVLAKFNTPCIDTKKLKECKERRQNKGLKESMKTRKSLKESDTRDTFTLDTSNTPILNCGLYYTLLGELNPGRYDERFKEFEGCVKECAKPILDELVRETPNFEVVSVGNYYHPRYYNYETDSLEFTVKYTGNDLGTVIEEYSNNQDFIDFLQNYKSYDGFISFFADNKDDFVKQDYVKSVSQIIKYNVTEEEYDEANENLYYDVMDCGFYPEDEDDTEESLKEKKYDIYVNDKYVSSSDRYKRAKDIEDKIRKDGKIKYAGEKAIKTAGVELDELNVDAKDKLKVKRARESKENKNLFAYRIYMRDRDKDFASGKDYKDVELMLKDAKKDFELANTELRTNPKYLVCMLFDLVDGEYYHYKNLYSAKEIEDEIKLEETPSKKESCQPKKKGKQLKEGFYGQTLDDFLDDCMDSSAIDKIYIYGNDDVVYEGTIDDIPEDMLETEFLECDMYTNKKSVVTVNVDTSEEYGAGIYEFLSEFLDDCNCELVVIYDLAEGEEIFNGDKEDIPEEYLEYAFVSYDAPEELSINLNDYDDEDDFDESLKEDNKALDKGKMITNSKGVSYYQKGNKYYSNTGWLEKEITKDEFDKNVEQAFKEVDESLDELNVGANDKLKVKRARESKKLKESDDKEVEKLDTFDDQMDFLAKDEQEAIDGYKKVINKVRNAKVKSQLKKIETEEKAHKDYLNKVKKNKDLEYTEPLIERKGNKCCNGKCKKANENLKEEYGNYRHSDFCSDISDELESGSTYGSVCTPYGEGCVDWQLDINGKIAEDFHCVEFLNYLLRDIAYPVRDGHLSYMGLDTIIPSDFNSDFDRKEFKHDLEMLGVYNKSSFDKFYRNKDNSYELEFWIDYDTNFDADEYEQLCDDELDSDSHFDESLKEAKGKIKIKDEIQRLVDKYSRLQKQYHGDSSASKKVEAEIDRLQCLLDMGKEYVDENLKEANDKKYFYELTDYEKKEVLGVLTSIAEFVKGDKEISTYLYKYNYQSGSTETTPISIWNESGEVSIRLDPEINSATARKIINKIKKQFDTKELWVYYDKSDGSLPPEIVIKYLNDGKNENLKEADNLQTRATKMLSVKKYQIDLAWKNGKTWKTDPMTLDEISKSVGARVTEKQFVDMMSDNIKGRKDAKNLTKAEIVKLYDYIGGKWKGKDVLWSIKGKTNENLSGGCGRKKTSKRAK